MPNLRFHKSMLPFLMGIVHFYALRVNINYYRSKQITKSYKQCFRVDRFAIAKIIHFVHARDLPRTLAQRWFRVGYSL